MKEHINDRKKDSAESSDCGGAGAIIKAGLIIAVLAVVTIVLHNKPPHNSGADNHSIYFVLLNGL